MALSYTFARSNNHYLLFMILEIAMKLFKLVLVVCAGLLFALACSNEAPNANQSANTQSAAPVTPAPASTPVDQLADARKLFGQTCSRCHGDNGAGGEFDLEGKKLKAPSLRDGHALKHDDAHLAKKIAEGGDGMPAFNKRLSPEQINNLVRFIHQDLQAGASATSTGNANHAAH